MYNTSDSSLKKNFIWKHTNNAYTLLLHSVTFNDSSFSAYAVKLNTFMTFSILPVDFNFIQNKLGHLPYTPEQCNKCHNAK